MALGDLIVKLSADVAQFQSDMGRAAHVANQQSAAIQRSLNGVRDTFEGLKSAAAFIAGLAVLREMKREAIEAEQASIRLDTALKATGFSAGKTRADLEAMTASLSQRTNFSGGDLRAAQAEFLKFGNIQGEVFNRGIRLAADWAAFVGASLPDAASSLGKALQSPEEGLKGLESAFGKLSFTQKEYIKSLVEQGKLLEAQQQVLKIVESRIGGTAEAMRGGLAGASVAVRKEFNDLLETLGKGGSRGNQALEGAASLLRDIRLTIEGTRNPLRELLLDLANFIDKLPPVASVLTGGLSGLAPDAIRGALGVGREVRGRITSPARDNAVAALGARLAEATAAAEARAEKAAEARKKAIAEGESIARRQQSARESLLQSYDNELNKLNDMTELEKLNFQISQGRLGLITQAFRTEAEQKARLIDLLRTEKKLREEMDRALKEDVGAKSKLQGDAEQINRELQNVRISVAELEGRTGDAAAQRFEQQNRNLLQTVGNTPELARFRQLTLAAAQFNDERQKQEQILARLSIEEERIQNALRVGAIGEIEAMNRTSAARLKSVGELDEIVRKLEEVAAASSNPALILQAEQARAALESLRLETNLLADRFNTVFSDSAVDAFTDFINGTKSASEAFRSFADSVVREINRIVAQDLANQLFGRGTGGGGPGGILAGIFTSGIGSILGGGGGSVVKSVAEEVISKVPAYDAGTPYVPRTQLAVVHEGERILTREENQRGGGRMTYAPTFNISGPVDKRSMQQIEAAAFAGAQRAAARNL